MVNLADTTARAFNADEAALFDKLRNRGKGVNYVLSGVKDPSDSLEAAYVISSDKKWTYCAIFYVGLMFLGVAKRMTYGKMKDEHDPDIAWRKAFSRATRTPPIRVKQNTSPGGVTSQRQSRAGMSGL